MAVVPVQFSRRTRVASGIYNAGEKAAFEEEVAAGLIRGGVAVRIKLAELAEPKKPAEAKA